MIRRVVVGFDGSAAAEAALAWAAGEARLRDAELVACTVLDRATTPRDGTDEVATSGLPASWADSAGGYPVTVDVRQGAAAAELVAAGGDADLLVVGSRGRGPVTELVLGSVSRACVLHAPCPVVVVRPTPPTASPHRRVIVGVDSSQAARHALRIAAEEARLRGAALHVVHAVHWDRIGTEWATPTRQELVRYGRRLVATQLAASGVTGRPVIIPGHAAEVLVRHSVHADLLVVGSGGHNRLAALLGSTAERCVRQAHCPVVVVHAPGDRESVEPAQADAHDRATT